MGFPGIGPELPSYQKGVLTTLLKSRSITIIP